MSNASGRQGNEYHDIIVQNELARHDPADRRTFLRQRLATIRAERWHGTSRDDTVPEGERLTNEPDRIARMDAYERALAW
jgi:hypothetical protein